MVGPEVRQGPVYGGVEPCRDQGILQPVTLRYVVVDIVAGDQGNTGVPGDPDQCPVAVGVAVQEVPVELHVHRAGAVPLQVPFQKRLRLSHPSVHPDGRVHRPARPRAA